MNKALKYAPKVARKAISQTRRDIADWKHALQIASAVKNPKPWALMEIYSDIVNDALMSSQINNRIEQTISAPFELINKAGKIDTAATDTFRHIPCIIDLMKYIWESEWYGCSLVELSITGGSLGVSLIDRRNVDPVFGRFYPDITFDNYIPYRDVSEYGKWLIEFNGEHIGNLNKLVPHALFKKFAQSCWSELCEIFGIPPRYIKTNTQDAAMLDRAESMMRDMGAASWFIIDTTEEFQFAQGVNTNGDVYANLIALCNNEISMMVSGAVIGQDTKNGNESKEKISVEMLNRLTDSDKRLIEMYMNTAVIPALYRVGFIPSGELTFRFSAAENTEKLWQYTAALLPFKQVDNDFISEKFGVPVADAAVPSADLSFLSEEERRFFV
ncbi:MAG: DUF935 domain-containing protein [Bacteroidales bacterium]|jgi:hypothetical protein|nr:DUF935 domain-containing protein [Bacteroidales bacterium]